MSIIQFLRILWAYRVMIAITTVATVIGALVAILVVPPAYEATTRVMLNTLKPDPITGEVVGGNSARMFLATQQQLIKDYGVAGQAVDALGWTSNPDNIAQYSASKGNRDRDIRRWLAQRIIDRTKVNVVVGTNILEIAFRAESSTEASAMANALRDAYINSTLMGRRSEATRNAAWYAEQADREKTLLDAADGAKTEYERANGIVMQDDKTDIETARLRSLAGQSPVAPTMAAPVVAAASPSAAQLVQLDAQIAQASQTLGANHPAMIEMRAKRATLAKMAAEEQSQARSAAAAASGTGRIDLNKAVSEQTQRVIANRDKIEHLTQLQGEVNLHREQMEKALSRASELRQEAAVADAGITVLSEAVTPTSPAFPNKPLILGGAVALGAAMGLFLALIVELLSRRVRGVEDLLNSVDAPLLAVIGSRGDRTSRIAFLSKFLRRMPNRRRRAAAA